MSVGAAGSSSNSSSRASSSSSSSSSLCHRGWLAQQCGAGRGRGDPHGQPCPAFLAAPGQWQHTVLGEGARDSARASSSRGRGAGRVTSAGSPPLCTLALCCSSTSSTSSTSSSSRARQQRPVQALPPLPPTLGQPYQPHSWHWRRRRRSSPPSPPPSPPPHQLPLHPLHPKVWRWGQVQHPPRASALLPWHPAPLPAPLQAHLPRAGCQRDGGSLPCEPGQAALWRQLSCAGGGRVRVQGEHTASKEGEGVGGGRGGEGSTASRGSSSSSRQLGCI